MTFDGHKKMPLEASGILAPDLQDWKIDSGVNWIYIAGLVLLLAPGVAWFVLKKRYRR